MLSLADRLARLPDPERENLIGQINEDEAQALLTDWRVWARPEQITPRGRWNIWLILAGRGWGKTRTGAEDVAAYGRQHGGSRIAVVAPTYADARDTCVEGESGLLAVLTAEEIRNWNRSLGELLLMNGTRYKLFSADQPERLRGPQHHRAWCDEVGSWLYPATFDMLMFGLRLGEDPQCVITTTPRPTKLLRGLLERVGRDVVQSGGSTFDNAAHLAPGFLQAIVSRYGSTRMGRQEINAEVLEDREGALWRREGMIEAYRVVEMPDLTRIVVGVDPSISDGEEAAECGIVVAGIAANGHGYVLDDRSRQGSPMEWAREVSAAYYRLKAHRIVAEVNQGGKLVETTLRAVSPNLPITLVHAAKAKQARAEPVSALYEQGRVHHVGSFPLLEDQCCQWIPGEDSPDRLDALVWAMTELFKLSEDEKKNPLRGNFAMSGVKGWNPR